LKRSVAIEMFSGIGMSSQMIANELECEEEEKWLLSQLIDFCG